ncbi:YfbM family protein [Gemella morbillorum]|uniref:YfbM family protein n=1 Tax=Gemella morbillorum TaxID=29391 RepID=UPI0023F02B91|nr:YfbM family protein [Gemella morbillorum]
MGIIANYQYLSDANLQELKSFYAEEDDIFEEVEDWNDEAEILLDIDKMWDALHFVLTGVSCIEPIKNNPLSEAVVGVFSIDGIEEYISYIEKSRIKDIVFALDNFDIEKALETFSMEECKEAELYPDIWDYEEEIDEIKEEIMDYFQNMKDFYKQVLEEDGNVLVTIY